MDDMGAMRATHLDFATLNRYLDGELDPPAQAAAAAHLAGCSRCRQELAALQALFADLEALEPLPLPTDLAARVVAEITPPPARRQTPLIWGLLAVQLVLTIVLGGWVALAAPTAALTEEARALAGPVVVEPVAEPLANLADWLTTRTAQLATDLQHMAASTAEPGTPLLPLGPLEWAILLLGGGLVWLGATRLSLRDLAGRNRQEVAL